MSTNTFKDSNESAVRAVRSLERPAHSPQTMLSTWAALSVCLLLVWGASNAYKTRSISAFSPLLSKRIQNELLVGPLYQSQPQSNRFPTFLYSVDSVKHSSPIVRRWNHSLHLFKSNPASFLSIPVAAALVGYITNWVGVKMIFYPIIWTGIPLYRLPNQPFGIFGWQGIIPAKRTAMATKLVDVTISKLLKVSEVFQTLKPAQLAALLRPTVAPVLLNNRLPSLITTLFLTRTARDLLRNIESVVDIKTLVITGLTTNPRTLGQFFQRVGRVELAFLVNSGFGFGFLLGLLQMFVWMLYPKNWTLPVGGAVVGYITNLIALKWIFEPIEPTKIGPFMLQGMFLQRQKEVSNDFSAYIADNILTSQNVWSSMLSESKSSVFTSILKRNVPLPLKHIHTIVTTLRNKVGQPSSMHAVHAYTTERMNLKAMLISRMQRLTPKEFEQVKKSPSSPFPSYCR